MVCFIHTRVSIQPWIAHNPVDEVVHNDGNVVQAPEPIVKGGCDLRLHELLHPLEASLSSPTAFPSGVLKNKNNRERCLVHDPKPRACALVNGASCRE